MESHSLSIIDISVMATLGVLAIGVASLWVYLDEKKHWNNGLCRKCHRPWRQFDVDSSGAVGYTCDGCQAHIWISYHSITKGK